MCSYFIKYYSFLRSFSVVSFYVNLHIAFLPRQQPLEYVIDKGYWEKYIWVIGGIYATRKYVLLEF